VDARLGAERAGADRSGRFGAGIQADARRAGRKRAAGDPAARWARLEHAALVADYSTVTTIPARGGRERIHFRADYVIGAIDWQPRKP
jgi:hypothetical protein